MIINILAIGDVCGTNGLEYLEKNLDKLKKSEDIRFTVANGENCNVVGVTPKQCDRLLSAGVDVVTLGNHTWTRWELQPYLNENSRVIRPANYAPQCPGLGFGIYDTEFGRIRVINLLGRFTLDTNTDNPYVVVDNILREEDIKLTLLDFHAEGTSEKRAMGYFLDGRVSAVWGTHTHVQTSDACVLPRGTGYITDLGMTGACQSVLGIDPVQSVNKFLGDPPRRYASAGGPCKIEGCVFGVDTDTGLCVSAKSVRFE